jgi:hypothetical protein
MQLILPFILASFCYLALGFAQAGEAFANLLQGIKISKDYDANGNLRQSKFFSVILLKVKCCIFCGSFFL